MGIAVRLLLLRYFAASRLSEACNLIRFGSIGSMTFAAQGEPILLHAHKM
jgi:hypothetical protein